MLNHPLFVPAMKNTKYIKEQTNRYIIIPGHSELKMSSAWEMRKSQLPPSRCNSDPVDATGKIVDQIPF